MRYYHLVADVFVGVMVAVALIGLGYARTFDSTMRWLLAWVVVDACATVVETYTRIVLQNSQYVAQVWYPVSAALALSVAASALGNSRGRRVTFGAAAAVAAVIVALTVLVEEFGYFSRYTGAMHGLALAIAGALMVVRRALTSRGEMLADPAFLVGSGFLIIGTPSAFLAISKWHFPISDREIRVFAYTLKNILSIGASGLFVAAFHHVRRATLRRQGSVVA